MGENVRASELQHNQIERLKFPAAHKLPPARALTD